MPFVLDSNVFIESKKRYYAFDVCPGFWDLLVFQQANANIISIATVRDEIAEKQDDLSNWVATVMPAACFAGVDADNVIAGYQQGMNWVFAQDQFTDAAKAEYANVNNADAWVIAYAVAHGMTVATEERLNLAKKSRVPIPNVCGALGIPCVDTVAMLRALGAQFRWP